MLDETFVLFRDFTPGRTIRVIVQPTDPTAEPTAEIELHVEEEEAEQEAPIMATFNGSVNQSSDDAGEAGSGTVTINGTTIGSGGANTWAGLRFQNVTIPQGSNINSAYITLYFTGSGNDSPNHWISCEAADNPTTFTTTSNDISGRPRTTEKATWSDNNIGTGNQNSPDLAAVIQEVTDRGGWSSGNALVIVIDAIATGDGIAFAAYDHASLAEPSITIDYTPPITGITTPKTAGIRLTTKIGGILTA